MNKKMVSTKKKVAVKKTIAPAKSAVKKRITKGESLLCNVCGLSVIVEEVGGIAVGEANALLCCGKPMNKKVKKAESTK